MNNNPSNGPGTLSTEQVGQQTISKSFHLTPRTIMAYAASIKDTNPLYFDDLRDDGLIAHPFIAFSFQWNTRFLPQLKANPRAAPFNVHAATHLRLHRAFKQGDLITSQGKVISMEQIKPGVKQVTRYNMTDAEGDLVAELDMIGIIRQAKIEGESFILEKTSLPPSRETDSQEAGSQEADYREEVLWEKIIHITADAAQIYTECAQIYNPIHTERAVAKAAGLPDIILHGSATQAISATEIINHFFGGESFRFKCYYGELRAMVLMNTDIRIRCLAEVQSDKGTEIYFDVLNAAGEPAITNGYLLGSVQ